MRSTPRRWLIVSALTAALLVSRAVLAPQAAHAHPLLPGWAEIVVTTDRIHVTLNVTVEQICVFQLLRVNDRDVYAADTLDKAYPKHGEHLVQHLFLHADGQRLAGKVTRWTADRKDLDPLEVEKNFVVYELEFPLPVAQRGKLPGVVQIQHDLLKDTGPLSAPWDAYFTVRINHSDRPFESALLKLHTPIAFDTAAYRFVAPTPKLDLTPAALETQPEAALPALTGPATSVTAEQTRVDVGSTLWEYLVHGVQHILHGPDHLLFIAALTLAALSFWDLVKVVSAFTAAHTLTLSLSVLDIVRVPERIVEPMIAASIVFVALENIFFPQRSRGWGRLAVAFAFGLFHGLGFAGGLVNAMAGMPTAGLAASIVAFSVGVEIGHQLIVLPLFGMLTLGRNYWDKKSAAAETPLEEPRLFSNFSLRYGSFVISVAGLLFLLGKLKLIHLDS